MPIRKAVVMCDPAYNQGFDLRALLSYPDMSEGKGVAKWKTACYSKCHDACASKDLGLLVLDC